ncbi:MAG: glycosyltransferase family 4 protein [Flavisolibacter sp.]
MSKIQDSYILWLCSWYPNKGEPFNGDFIQRHAAAAASFEKISLIHFTQTALPSEAQESVREDGKLKEHIVYIPFKPSGFYIWDKIHYNFRYYVFARKYLLEHFKKNGLPKLVHVHIPLKAGNLALWIKKSFHIPYLVSEHGSYYLPQAIDSYYKRNFFYKKQLTIIFRRADALSNVSLAIGKIISKLFRVPIPKVIHNVVDTEIFYVAPLAPPTFTYIHVSSLSEQKNIFGLIKAFSKLASLKKDWKLLIVGPYSQALKLLIDELKLSPQVTLTGEVNYSAVAGYMQKAHVLALFSSHENFPCVVIEALCCGLPVICTDVGGTGEAVNVSNGILIAQSGEKALLDGLINIRDQYGHYDRMEIAKMAREKYNYRFIGNQFHALYEEILNKRLKIK